MLKDAVCEICHILHAWVAESSFPKLVQVSPNLQRLVLQGCCYARLVASNWISASLSRTIQFKGFAVVLLKLDRTGHGLVNFKRLSSHLCLVYNRLFILLRYPPQWAECLQAFWSLQLNGRTQMNTTQPCNILQTSIRYFHIIWPLSSCDLAIPTRMKLRYRQDFLRLQKGSFRLQIVLSKAMTLLWPWNESEIWRKYSLICFFPSEACFFLKLT